MYRDEGGLKEGIDAQKGANPPAAEMRTTSDRPRIAIIGTGGSISFRGRHSLDLYEYADYGEVLQVDEVVTQIPEIAQAFEAVCIRFRAIPSTALLPADWLELNDLIHHVFSNDAGLAGAVITHGTATMEETAYFLHLALKVERPVVLVGSQRPLNGLSSDASLNLLNACRTAASPSARGLGVLVVVNDEIQSAREVTKTSTYRLEAFRTPDLGMLGFADADGKISIYRSPTRRHTVETEFDTRGMKELPRVDIAYSYAGSGATAINAFVANGADGVVLASLAPGKPTPEEARAASEAQRSGVLMVQSTRAGSGRVLQRTRLTDQGFVAADNLNPQKARVLTMLALTKTHDRIELQRMFTEY